LGSDGSSELDRRRCTFWFVCFQATLRAKVADIRFELTVNSSEETEEEGCRGFEDEDHIADREDGSKQGCEDTFGSEAEILNSNKTEILSGNKSVVDVNVKQQGNDIVDSADILLQSSFPRSRTKVTEISTCSDFYQKVPEVASAEMESGCKGEMSLQLPDSSLKQPEVSRDGTVSAMQATVVSSATAQPAKRKVRTVGTDVDRYTE
jgi:hypothetical protein